MQLLFIFSRLAAPLVASFLGILRVQGEKKKKIRAPEKGGHGHVPRRACAGFVVKLPYISLSLGKTRLSFKLSNLLPGFSHGFVVPFSYSTYFPRFFPGQCLPPFMVAIMAPPASSFGFYCALSKIKFLTVFSFASLKMPATPQGGCSINSLLSLIPN